MNYNQKNFKRNRLLQNIRHSNRSGSHESCIRISTSNTLEHEEVKFKIAYKLKCQGFEIWTEVIFNNGKKADIMAIKNGIGYIIEVLHSETEKMLSKKVKDYPSEFEILSVKTKDFDFSSFEI